MSRINTLTWIGFLITLLIALLLPWLVSHSGLPLDIQADFTTWGRHFLLLGLAFQVLGVILAVKKLRGAMLVGGLGAFVTFPASMIYFLGLASTVAENKYAVFDKFEKFAPQDHTIFQGTDKTRLGIAMIGVGLLFLLGSRFAFVGSTAVLFGITIVITQRRVRGWCVLAVREDFFALLLSPLCPPLAIPYSWVQSVSTYGKIMHLEVRHPNGSTWKFNVNFLRIEASSREQARRALDDALARSGL